MSYPTSIGQVFCLLFVAALPIEPAAAIVQSSEVNGEDGRRLVLENDHARVMVWPEAGGAIVEYIDKKSGVNFATGPVERGKALRGWKDMASLHASDDGLFASLPHDAELVLSASGKAIRVRCEVEGYSVERTVSLADDGAELRVQITHTNRGDAPRRLWIRWHPYMQLDDPFAEHSALYVPGPGPDNLRTVRVGSGYESWFLEPRGYALAANWKSGQGLWMTYDPQQVVVLCAWTDYQHNKPHERRGDFTFEPWTRPQLTEPGKSVMLDLTYCPISVNDSMVQVPAGLLTRLGDDTQAEARQFLTRVQPNLQALGEHTMTPARSRTAGNVVAQNRFAFQHRRRDRMALHDWGFADAMLACGGLQSLPLRLRLYARLFESQTQPIQLRYELSITDARGQRVRHKVMPRTLTPVAAALLDERQDVPIEDLPDGWYTLTLEVFAGDGDAPIHTYQERRKLAAAQHQAMAAAWQARTKEGLKESDFVRALRQVVLPAEPGAVVPIGVENASPIARRQWPVTAGVPLHASVAPRGQAWTLTGPDGRPVPVQTQVTGTWPDGSVKWLLASFAADLPADSHVFYTLSPVTGQDVAQEPPLIQVRDGALHIDTGARQWRWSTQPKQDERLMDWFGSDDLWWIAGDGRRHVFALRGPEAGMSVEENGSQRAVVRVVGWYWHPNTREPICRGELRAEFHRGQSHVRLYHTYTYAGNPWSDELRGCGVRFRLQPNASFVELEQDGRTRRASRSLSLRQFHDNVCDVELDGQPISGQRSNGAAALWHGDRRTAIYHRDFWRMHPKQVRLDAAEGVVDFDYWPQEAGPRGYLPREDGWLPSSSGPAAIAVGFSRTHEFVIDPSDPHPLSAYEEVHDDPVLALTPPRHLAASRAMMHLQPFNPQVVPELEQRIQLTLDAFEVHQSLWGWYGQWEYGGIPNIWLNDESRWTDYGRYAFILNEQNIVQAPWLAYMRSGDRRYFRFARANTRHLLEVGTIRLAPIWPEYVGLSRRHHECIWLSDGDWGHSMLDPFLEMYRVTGYRPAWEAALRMAEGMAQLRKGTWRYISNPLAGLSRMYLETQDPAYREQADRIWRDLCFPEQNRWWVIDHGSRAAIYYRQINPQCDEVVKRMAMRDSSTFNTSDIVSALYLDTKEPRFAQALARRFAGGGKRSASRDPLMSSIPTITQYVLANVREWCYASSTIMAGREAGKVPVSSPEAEPDPQE